MLLWEEYKGDIVKLLKFIFLLLMSLVLLSTQIFSNNVDMDSKKSLDSIIWVSNVKKGSKKDKLLQTIHMKDVIIYDLDHHENLVIAVGEDNSPQTRKRQYDEEGYSLPIILRSTNSGKSWKKLTDPGEEGDAHSEVIILDEKRIIVASVYEAAGTYMHISSDGGDHWVNSKPMHGVTVSLEQIGQDIVLVTSIQDVVWKSKDRGINWVKATWSEAVDSIYENYKTQPKETIMKELIDKIMQYNAEEKYNTCVPYFLALEKLVGEYEIPNRFNYMFANALLHSDSNGIGEIKYVDLAIMKLEIYLKRASKDEKLFKPARELLDEAYFIKEQNEGVE